MNVDCCYPSNQIIHLENISYEDAVILQVILERESESVHEQDRVGQTRWAELIEALKLIIVANQPAETLSASNAP